MPETNELTLGLGELQLNVTLIERQVEELNQPYMDWLVCDVRASVPHFVGTFPWEVMPAELERLANELSTLHARFPQLGKVNFRAKYSIALTFELTKVGHVLGHFELYPYPTDDTRLEGSFRIDQSFLPILASDIRAFLDSSTAYVRRSTH